MELPPCPWCDEEPNGEYVEFFQGVAELHCDSCGKPIIVREVIMYEIEKVEE